MTNLDDKFEIAWQELLDALYGIEIDGSIGHHEFLKEVISVFGNDVGDAYDDYWWDNE